MRERRSRHTQDTLEETALETVSSSSRAQSDGLVAHSVYIAYSAKYIYLLSSPAPLLPRHSSCIYSRVHPCTSNITAPSFGLPF